MKAISLYEPWATLVALGLKRYETRYWKIFYRGPLLICASKNKLPFIEIASLLYAAKLTTEDLQYGKILAVVDLVEIFPTNNLIVPDSERKWGDFTWGRYAWQFTNIRRLVNPPVVRGRQGLFNVPDDLIKNIEMYESI